MLPFFNLNKYIHFLHKNFFDLTRKLTCTQLISPLESRGFLHKPNVHQDDEPFKRYYWRTSRERKIG